MTLTEYIAPAFGKESFHCPICGVLAVQTWCEPSLMAVARDRKSKRGVGSLALERLAIVHCLGCDNHSVWVGQKMVYPDGGNAPLPHAEMPALVAEDFNEARGIMNKSPKAAAALLRLAIQRLVMHLGQPGKNLNSEIGSLVANGLPSRVQKALDSVRVIGNNAVHPGQIELNDNPQIAHALFDLVNLVVEIMIAQPKALDAIYGSLPQTALDQIANRDN